MLFTGTGAGPLTPPSLGTPPPSLGDPDLGVRGVESLFERHSRSSLLTFYFIILDIIVLFQSILRLAGLCKERLLHVFQKLVP